jgi:hypothetical protein
MTANPDNDLAGRLATVLAALPEVQLAYLFGSHAHGRAGAESDIDLGIQVTREAAMHAHATLARIFDRLGRAAPSDRLDLVLLNDAPSLLRHRILTNGKLLFAREPEARLRFATRAIRDYQDMQFRREFFYRERLKRLKEGSGHGRSGDLLAQARRVARLFDETQGLSGND